MQSIEAAEIISFVTIREAERDPIRHAGGTWKCRVVHADFEVEIIGKVIGMTVVPIEVNEGEAAFV